MASMEFQCSVCCLTQPVTAFSKAARKREDPICQRCTSWSVGVEPEVTPSALQTGHISIEEIRGEVWVEEYLNTRNGSENVPSIRDRVEPPSSASSCGGVKLNMDQASVDDHGSEVSDLPPSEPASSLRGPKTHVSRGLPTHLRRGGSTIASTSGRSTVMSKASPETESLQARLLRKAGPPASSASVTSGSNVGSNVESISTATTMREARNRTPVVFNRWDSSGNAHPGVRDDTTASSTTNSTITTRASRQGWAKPEAVQKDTAPLRAIPVVRECRAEREFNAQKCTSFCTGSDVTEDDSE